MLWNLLGAIETGDVKNSLHLDLWQIHRRAEFLLWLAWRDANYGSSRQILILTEAMTHCVTMDKSFNFLLI